MNTLLEIFIASNCRRTAPTPQALNQVSAVAGKEQSPQLGNSVAFTSYLVSLSDDTVNSSSATFNENFRRNRTNKVLLLEEWNTTSCKFRDHVFTLQHTGRYTHPTQPRSQNGIDKYKVHASSVPTPDTCQSDRSQITLSTILRRY